MNAFWSFDGARGLAVSVILATLLHLPVDPANPAPTKSRVPRGAVVSTGAEKPRPVESARPIRQTKRRAT